MAMILHSSLLIVENRKLRRKKTHYLGSTSLQASEVRTSGKWAWALVNFKSSPFDSNVQLEKRASDQGKDTVEKQEKAKKEDLMLLPLK